MMTKPIDVPCQVIKIAKKKYLVV